MKITAQDELFNFPGWQIKSHTSQLHPNKTCSIFAFNTLNKQLAGLGKKRVSDLVQSL